MRTKNARPSLLEFILSHSAILLIFSLSIGPISSERDAIRPISLPKCCQFQGQVQLNSYGCPTCRNVTTSEQEGQIHNEFPELLLQNRLRLNEILLLPTTSSPASQIACHGPAKRVTVSLRQLQSNLTSGTPGTQFLRLGRRVAVPTTAICIDKILRRSGSTERTESTEIDVDVELLIVSSHVPILNKCCGLDEVFDAGRNRCGALFQVGANGVLRRGHVQRKRFQGRRGLRNHVTRGAEVDTDIDASGLGELSHFMDPGATIGVNVNVSHSYSVMDGWLEEAIKSGKYLGIKNFTSRSCWFQHATRFKLSTPPPPNRAPDMSDSHPSSIPPPLLLNYESNQGVFLRGAWKSVHGPHFCVERVQNYGGICTGGFVPDPIGEADHEHLRGRGRVPHGQLLEHPGIVIVFYIAPDSVTEDPTSYATLMGVSWWAISGFLAVAAVVNVTIIQKNIHGWVFFSYLITSALLNVVAGVFIMIANDDPDKVGCNFFDFLQKFLYLSTLCWMTAINFDLWYAFRKLEPTLQSSVKRFPFYILFSWAVPVVVIVVGWFMGDLQHTSPIPLAHCIIYDYSTIVYMSGPVVVLIGVNLLLFIRTVMIIRDLRNASNRVLQRSHVERESFKLFTKLFLMTGPIWILRIVLLVLQIRGSYLTWYGTLIEFLFMVPDIAFFSLVIFHRKVIERVNAQFPCFKGIMCCCASGPSTHKPGYAKNGAATTMTGAGTGTSLRVHYGRAGSGRSSSVSINIDRHQGQGAARGSRSNSCGGGGGANTRMVTFQDRRTTMTMAAAARRLPGGPSSSV